jgi:transcriptional regulator with XRE-family HTH domain
MSIRIKELRARKNIKQSELADMLHVSQATLSNWEREEFEPDKECLMKLAEILDSSIDYILGRADHLVSYSASNIRDSHFVQGNGSVDVGADIKISKEEAEILRVYRLLGVRERAKLMSVIFEFEDEILKQDGEVSE